MKITEILGRVSRARDRLSMGQKSAGIVFQYLVGRSDWDYETANGLRTAQQRLPQRDTLENAITHLEEAIHDLKLVKQQMDERAHQEMR